MTEKKNFYRASAVDFGKIPGSPIAYWVSQQFLNVFQSDKALRAYGVTPCTGLQTGDNGQFIRKWFEVPIKKFSIKWFKLNNGGEVRKWFGNFIDVINWANDGFSIKEHRSAVIRNSDYYFKEGATWNRISSSFFAIRYLPPGLIFDQAGDSLFTTKTEVLPFMMAYLNSALGYSIMKIICPTLNATAGNIENFPYPLKALVQIDKIAVSTNKLIQNSQSDWNSFETSWDFNNLPLLKATLREETLITTYNELRSHWKEMACETQALETENNRIFITAYGLESELTPEVPLKEITLTCNPHYRYGGDKTESELESFLLADTMREFISYSVGCMFGRYSLDKPGLILANAGETITDYLSQIPNPTFMPDTDNVIPLMSMDWFTDDLAERFKEFLKITFGTENFDTNLQFIEKALGKNGKPLTIREYFLKDFYNDHTRRYKKRPIYWLFSSPKGSFNALIYMHRYRPDTVSSILNGYLREFRTKLTATKNHLEAVSISAAASAGEKTKALKDIENIRKIIEEIDVYERDILYPLATKQIEIDLDDGVKVNYQKFGTAVKKIVGLDSKEED